jgi:steroid Delta-isomerase
MEARMTEETAAVNASAAMVEPRAACDTPAPAACAVERVVHFYENLHAVRSSGLAEGIAALYAADARFKDPFNEVQGTAAIARIFEHMFATVDAPRFVVTTRIVQGEQAMLGWDFHLTLRGQAVIIHGVTHLRFDTAGKVSLHRDYWDAAEELYARLPLIGRLMRLLQRRLSAHP